MIKEIDGVIDAHLINLAIGLILVSVHGIRQWVDPKVIINIPSFLLTTRRTQSFASLLNVYGTIHSLSIGVTSASDIQQWCERLCSSSCQQEGGDIAYEILCKDCIDDYRKFRYEIDQCL
jgi:hypothetical protein